jgi:TolB-like protein
VRRALAVVALLIPSLAAATTTPSVAVMPFKDLSGGKGSVGEAIRETVTTDLRDVPGMRVIERANIDKILTEQNLQGRKADLDPLSTVKVGKLLGATLIVGGAYQKVASTVRLTARFVKVETGEIVGTAKVDGSSSDFLQLQDRVTAELLKSAGIKDKEVVHYAKRVRPKVKSYKAIELYGDAVVETDDKKKREFLKLALNEDPDFSYAVRDLDELEKRLKQYDALNQKENDAALAALLEQVKTEKDPQKLFMAYMMAFAKLQLSRRWHKVAALSRHALKNPPPPSLSGNIAEYAQQNIVNACSMLRDYDCVLREGEKFLATYPGSLQFMGVRSTVDAAIEYKRTREEGKAKAAGEIANLTPAQKANPCQLGQIYNTHKQMREAIKHLEQCAVMKDPSFPPVGSLQLLVVSAFDMGDFAAARKYIERLSKVDPAVGKSMAAMEVSMPTDG